MFFEKLKSRAASTALWLGVPPAKGEDILGDSLLKVMQGRVTGNRLTEIQALAYIGKMVRRRCFDYLRTAEYRNRHQTDDALQLQRADPGAIGKEEEETTAEDRLRARFDDSLGRVQGQLGDREKQLLDWLSHDRKSLLEAIAGEMGQRQVCAGLNWNQSKASRSLAALRRRIQQTATIEL